MGGGGLLVRMVVTVIATMVVAMKTKALIGMRTRREAMTAGRTKAVTGLHSPTSRVLSPGTTKTRTRYCTLKQVRLHMHVFMSVSLCMRVQWYVYVNVYISIHVLKKLFICVNVCTV